MSDDTPDQTEPEAPAESPTPTAHATEPTPTVQPTEPKKSPDVIHLPRWVVFVVAAAVLLGAGFGIGWAAAPSGNGPEPAVRIPFPGGGAFFGPGGGRFQVPAQSGAFLGVETGSASQGVSVVSVVSGGPADQAGLKAGDVITAVNGTTVSSPAALAQQIESHQPGDQVTISYTRSGAAAQASVKLGSHSSTTTPTAPPS